MKRFTAVLLILFVSLHVLGQSEETDVAGRIAYIGTDYNVYVLTPADGIEVQMTNDATRRRHYLWPTWATNDKLAFFCCEQLSTSGDIDTEVFISADGVVAPELAYLGEGQIFTYAAWAPGDCVLGDKCRDLAVLLTGSSGFDVQLIRSHEDITNRLLGMGAPFYYSWSPSAERLVLQRNNRRLDVYNVGGEEIETLEERPGLMQAPDWSPVDDRLLFGRLDAEALATDLVVFSDDEVQIVADDLDGQVSSNWSPDGRYVAYRTVTDQFSNMSIFDTRQNVSLRESNVGGVIAFFWSPDSEKLALVTFAAVPSAFNISTSAQPERLSLTWWVMDVASGSIARYASFVPTDSMIYILGFFDQFSQSHRLWSPDSTHLVYAEIQEDGTRSINLLDTRRTDAVPFSVANGEIGIWSYR